jgi:exportin-7
MVDLGEDEDKFHSFMVPLTGKLLLTSTSARIHNNFQTDRDLFHVAQLENVGQLLVNAETSLFRSEEAKWTIVGLARDLRGIVFAFNTRTSYMMFYDWM